MRVSARSALSLHVVAVVKMVSLRVRLTQETPLRVSQERIDVALFDVVLALALDRY